MIWFLVDPLLVINGKKSGRKSAMGNKLDLDDIMSIQFRGPEGSTLQQYGADAKQGVLEITLKEKVVIGRALVEGSEESKTAQEPLMVFKRESTRQRQRANKRHRPREDCNDRCPQRRKGG